MTPQQEEAFGRAWRKMAFEEGHRKGAPQSQQYAGNKTENRPRSGVALSIKSAVHMARDGMSGRQIGEAVGISYGKFMWWLESRDLSMAKLRDMAAQEDAA